MHLNGCGLCCKLWQQFCIGCLHENCHACLLCMVCSPDIHTSAKFTTSLRLVTRMVGGLLPLAISGSCHCCWLEQLWMPVQYRTGNYEEAVVAYIRAAEMGMEVGQSNAAWMLSRGYGVQGPAAAALAMKLHQRAAGQV